MINVDKKEGEPNESVIRRWTRKVRSSGMLDQKKKSQFFAKKMNRRQKRQKALRRTQKQEEYDLLVKTGKIEESPRFGHYQKRNKKR